MVANNTIDFSQLDDIAAALEPTLKICHDGKTYSYQPKGPISRNIRAKKYTYIHRSAHLVRSWTTSESPASLSTVKLPLTKMTLFRSSELSRRAIIKTIAMVGSARAHYAMIILMQAVSEDVKAKLSKDVYRTEEEQDYKLVSKRGQDFARRQHRYVPRAAAGVFLRCVWPIYLQRRYYASEGVRVVHSCRSVIPLQIEDYINIHIKGSAVYGANKDEINAAMADRKPSAQGWCLNRH
ncbi:hypothetical protein DL89DRAFT_282515 [Linderina pennispora]|uniref:Uncharacterized protein n=1 Tax=Linderina pennispora TaxID=61395 RepID=A0A1Y1WFW6_9FUNG|nr:uncharacterized protein DL89DRAFT_282515 [Linderina pennispora]ORX72461.1 hypothetical protein DL89DRAFT_282515 [Linderina pennispora]